MPIRSFAYENLDTGWKLEETSFGALNLLVGPSGAGKSLILKALLDIRRAALSGAKGIPSSRWKLDVEMKGQHFSWEAETRVTRAEMPEPGKSYSLPRDSSEETDARFVNERISRDQEVLIERNGTVFRFAERDLPKLTESESAIGLLAQEDTIFPLHDGLRLWRVLETEFTLGSLASIQSAEAHRRRLGGRLELLKRDSSPLSLLKLYFLQQDHREVFDRILEDFSDIFGTVQDLRIATFAELDARPNLGEGFMANHLTVGLQEQGVEGWIMYSSWSSGMLKTLKFLIETTLAAEGTVLLIDELEEGLGINCLPEVAGRMLQGLDRIQYIATSHHPRIINEIPYRRWKLVTRRGSQVRVLDAKDIPALSASSSLERFTELINLPEYVEGVA